MAEFGPDIRSITSSLLRFEITPEERDYTLDLRPVMNPTPTTVMHSTPLPQECVFEYERFLEAR